MPTRKRISTAVRKVGGGGGGGPAPGGTISWGPSFGQSAGNDASTWNPTAAVDLDRIRLRSEKLRSNCAVDLASVDIRGGVTASGDLGGTVLGAPFWQSVETAARTTAGTTITVNKPAGVQAGDLLLAFVGQNALSVSEISAPDGWIPITQKNIGVTVKTAISYYKVATASEPTSYTFTSSNNSAPFTAEVHHIIATDNNYQYFPDSSGNGNGGRIWGDVSSVVSPWAGFGNAADCGGVPDNDQLSSGVVSESTINTAGLASFVLEAKVRIPSDNFGVVFALTDTDPATSIARNGVVLFLAANDSLQILTYSNGAGVVNTTGSSISYPFEGDLAIAWDGATIYLLVDGVVDTSASLASFPAANMHVSAGRSAYNPASGVSPYPVDCIIDELRLSLNTDRGYTSGYTPATTPFTTDANTEVLWHFDSISGSGRGPIDAAASATLSGASLDPDPDTPSVTTTVDNCLVFSYIYHDHGILSQSHTPPSGHIETTDFQSTPVGDISASNSAWRVYATPGATGTAEHNCTETVATDAVMMRIAIAPGPLVIA